MTGDYYAMMALFQIDQRNFVDAYHRRIAATGAHKPTQAEVDLWKATYNQISNLKMALEAYVADQEEDDLTTLPSRKI